MTATGQLISRTSTTGWSDWHHGDLFLTADALIRVRLAEPTREARRFQDTVGPLPQFRPVPSAAEAHLLLAADPTDRYLPLSEVASARLHRGILSDRLALVLRSGAHLKLLWLRADPAHAVLRRALPAVLGPAFALD